MHLITSIDLERTLGADAGPLDDGMADWVISTVSIEAQELTGRFEWEDPDDVPPAVTATLIMAARRLYTNPDRMTRESEDGYSYGLDSSVTSADIFTPVEEKRLLRYATPEVRRNARKLGTVKTCRGDAHQPVTRWY